MVLKQYWYVVKDDGFWALLIGLYGIETALLAAHKRMDILLIGLYGIETAVSEEHQEKHRQSFNWTIWY